MRRGRTMLMATVIGGFVMLAALALISSCAPADPSKIPSSGVGVRYVDQPDDCVPIADGVCRVKDYEEQNTCYLYFSGAISCVKDY